jgi:hypothetical protein
VARATPLTSDEHLTLTDIASRIGIGVWSARLHARERQVAEVLKRALLPRTLPLRDGVLHAYDGEPGDVRLRIELAGSWLTMCVEDWGRWKRSAGREHGGRGLRLARKLMDRVEIETEHRHTTVHLRKTVAFT